MSSSAHAPADTTPAPSDQAALPGLLFQPQIELRAALVASALLLLGWTGRALLDVPAAETLVWASLAIGMIYGLRAALDAIRDLSVDIDVLMVVGAALAAGVGHPEEGALLLCLFVLSGALEARALERTRREVEALHKLMPSTARVLRDGEWLDIDPGEIRVGERIRIRPGDLIPVDARVVEGESMVDQSSLTGESLPREVAQGDEIFAGAVNASSVLEAEAIRPAAESSLQKVLSLVIEAREQRPPAQRVIDRLSRPYAVSVLAVSAAVVLIWWLAFRVPFADAAYTAITFLIVMSPCALIISTPTVTLSAIARSARAGVLFKGGQALELLSRTNAACLDKTGTLTFGRPRVIEARPVAWSSEEDLWRTIAGLEADSTHPIGVAVQEAARRRGVQAADVRGVALVPGRGLIGAQKGFDLRLGNAAHVEPVLAESLRPVIREALDEIHAAGQIGVVVARTSVDARHAEAAILVVSDPVRPAAAAMVERLHHLGVRPIRMLTGDNRVTAARVAESLGVDQWEAELFPADKLDRVRAMRDEMRAENPRRRAGIAFIGDGVNDAPALAAADVGLAIGSIGSDAALESADIVLLSDDLRAVPWSIAFAKRARRILIFNITFALTVIIAMAVATLVGSRAGWPVPMSVGVIAHEGGTLFVVLNALRLLYAPGWSADGERAPSTPADAHARTEAPPMPAEQSVAAA
jgi:Cd2+/Zn2+-exporting ATPase